MVYKASYRSKENAVSVHFSLIKFLKISVVYRPAPANRLKTIDYTVVAYNTSMFVHIV